MLNWLWIVTLNEIKFLQNFAKILEKVIIVWYYVQKGNEALKNVYAKEKKMKKIIKIKLQK